MRKPTLLGLLASLAASLMLCGCNAESETSRYPAYLVIDNSVHNDATLASAMDPMANTFVTITLRSSGGLRQFHFESNKGTSSTVGFNAVDQRLYQARPFELGMNGALIVGYGTATDGVFYAYDRECPNCFSPDALPLRSRPLSVNDFGIATCPLCHRQYDLNNGGVIVAGDGGSKMTRYPASATGPYGRLAVY